MSLKVKVELVDVELGFPTSIDISVEMRDTDTGVIGREVISAWRGRASACQGRVEARRDLV